MTRWQPDQPYNELPLLPPSRALETTPVLRAAIAARASLAALDRSAELIPNPGMLINTLPLLEAQASSEIENVVTTADVLFQHVQAHSAADPATREALRYREALLEGFQQLATRPLTTRTAEQICSRIKGAEMAVRRVPGTTLQSAASGEVIYTPPESEARLRGLLANWEAFIHEEEGPDPLVRMAVAHYQFEAIHPFTDGNGRTGRVLNSLLLVQMGLLRLPILYLSRFIIRNKSEYYELLLSVTRDEAWEPWVLYVLRGVDETARWTIAKIDAVRALEQATAEYVRRALPRVYSHEMVQVLFQQPYCRIANLVESGLMARQAASRHLKQLVATGVLQERVLGREKLFVNVRLLRMLTTEANEFGPFER